MANKILPKYRELTTGEPTLLKGEIATNLFDKNFFVGTGTGNIVFQDKDAIDTALAGKVDDSQVLTDVPAGAVFTDTETLTTLSLATNTLSYVDENGATTNIDLSLYLDDTNLAYLTAGTVNGTTGIATFTRSDATTFTVDMSALLDDTTYTLPEATATVRGGIELFSNTDQAVGANGITATAARTYGIQLNTAGQAVVNVPWVDTNTVYTHPTNATTNIDTIGAEVIDLLTTTSEGHISAMSKRTMTLANLGYTGSTTANDYSHPSVATTNIVTSGAEVVGSLSTTAEGHVSVLSKRTMTLANLGYTGATNANFYVLPFTNNSTNWNTAFGWGNHAVAGYLNTSSNIDGGTY